MSSKRLPEPVFHWSFRPVRSFSSSCVYLNKKNKSLTIDQKFERLLGVIPPISKDAQQSIYKHEINRYKKSLSDSSKAPVTSHIGSILDGLSVLTSPSAEDKQNPWKVFKHLYYSRQLTVSEMLELALVMDKRTLGQATWLLFSNTSLVRWSMSERIEFSMGLSKQFLASGDSRNARVCLEKAFLLKWIPNLDAGQMNPEIVYELSRLCCELGLSDKVLSSSGAIQNPETVLALWSAYMHSFRSDQAKTLIITWYDNYGRHTDDRYQLLGRAIYQLSQNEQTLETARHLNIPGLIFGAQKPDSVFLDSLVFQCDEIARADHPKEATILLEAFAGFIHKFLSSNSSTKVLDRLKDLYRGLYPETPSKSNPLYFMESAFHGIS